MHAQLNWFYHLQKTPCAEKEYSKRLCGCHGQAIFSLLWLPGFPRRPTDRRRPDRPVPDQQGVSGCPGCFEKKGLVLGELSSWKVSLYASHSLREVAQDLSHILSGQSLPWNVDVKSLQKLKITNSFKTGQNKLKISMKASGIAKPASNAFDTKLLLSLLGTQIIFKWV